MQRIVFYMVGLAILFLNKVRYGVRGYREPRPFAPTQTTRTINYDRSVVHGWLKALHDYTGETVDGKVVLELGPGADLGPALFLLDAGAQRYMTVDANRLIDQAPADFYTELIQSLSHANEIKPELEKTLAGHDDRIQYVVDPAFDLTQLEADSVDVTVSQAAFEHFSDIEKTIKQLTAVVKSGGVLVAEIDTMTHTGLLRTRDPLNIYRYSPLLYRLARFSGIPNRVRTHTYKQLLEDHNWYNVQIIPLQTLSPDQLNQVKRGLARPFRNDPEMYVLTFLLLATRR